MEAIVNEAAYIVAILAESVAVLVILIGIIMALFTSFSKSEFFQFKPEMISRLRMQLGNSLSLSLEFLIGADILKTAISPSWNEIGMLGAIVVIRTVLNFFLTQEIKLSQSGEPTQSGLIK